MACFRIFLAVILINFIYVVFAAPVNLTISLKLRNKKRVKVPNVCKTKNCEESAKELLDYIDLGADPCLDFFNFTCGNYIKKALPKGVSSKATLTDVRLSNMKKLKSLLEDPINETEAHFIKQTKTYYKYCMNSSYINKTGLQAMQKALKDFGGWPIIEGDEWNEEKINLTSILIKLQVLGLVSIFELDIQAIRKNFMIMLERPVITFPSGSYNRKFPDGWMLDELSNLILNVSLHLGRMKKNKRITDSANDIVQFEEKIVHCSNFKPQTEKDKETALFLDILKHMFKSVFDFESFFKSVFKQVNVYIKSDEIIGIFSKPYFQCLSVLMKNTPKRNVVNFLLWKMIQKSLFAMPIIFMEMEENFNKITRLKPVPSRWYDCVEIIHEDMYQFVAHMFIKKYFNRSTKIKVLRFIRELKKAFRKLISYQRWLEPKTKAAAISKLDHMRDNVGYPDQLEDEKHLEDMFNKMDFNGRPLLDVFYISRYIKMKEFTKSLGSKVDLNTMDLPVTTINALYLLKKNKIEFPAAILVPPVYSDAYPMYLNFGGIGSIIGHEISHGFDSKGSLYDQDGDKRDWWQAKDKAKFITSTICLINQYNGLVFEQIKQKANGSLTLRENMADAGGLRIAYMAYKQWLRKHGEEVQLPGIPYNSEQMFFMAYGRALCSKDTDESASYSLKKSEHSLGIFRVNIPTKNLKMFSKAFKCKPSSVMNPSKRCRIW